MTGQDAKRKRLKKGKSGVEEHWCHRKKKEKSGVGRHRTRIYRFGVDGGDKEPLLLWLVLLWMLLLLLLLLLLLVLPLLLF